MIWKTAFRMLRMVDAEKAHGWAVKALAAVPDSTRRSWLGKVHLDPRLSVELLGLDFPNPVGMAAGFDKDAECFASLLALGFGHVEVGTVTPLPQEGNPQPRIWRFHEHRSLVNAMGFPGKGEGHVSAMLEKRDPLGVVGVNIGKNKDTEYELGDYGFLVSRFRNLADYITVNVSSPNTAGLRHLEQAKRLKGLLVPLVELAQGRPLLVKFSPDMEPGQLEASAEAAVECGVSGIIATNTTVNRRELHDRGGLSGSLLKQQANEAMKILYRTVGERTVLIGVGGISSAADVVERVMAGAHMVQLYTGFVYEGPMLARKIVDDLREEADRECWSHIHDLRGTAA